MSHTVHQGLVVHYGLDGSIRVDERSLLRSQKVQEQLQATLELTELLGLPRVNEPPEITKRRTDQSGNV